MQMQQPYYLAGLKERMVDVDVLGGSDLMVRIALVDHLFEQKHVRKLVAFHLGFHYHGYQKVVALEPWWPLHLP
jgi:hypothetical protein